MSRAADPAPGAEGHEIPMMRLDDVLKFFGVAATGGHAKHMIQAGEVRVNGVVETRRKRRIVDGDTVEAGGEAFVVELVPAPEDEPPEG